MLSDVLGVMDDGSLLVAASDQDGGTRLVQLGLRVFERPMGDVNADGVVNWDDLNSVISSVQRQDPSGDVNGDGTVDALDVSAVVQEFGVIAREVMPTLP